jgi:hypothetical protein
MIEADYPDSYGYSWHGPGGGIPLFWHSYLLIEHPRRWGIALFVWMWSPVVGLLVRATIERKKT